MQWWFQSQKGCKDKLKLTRIKHGIIVTSKEKRKVRLGFHSLPKPQAKLDGSTPIDGFLSLWGFNGGQRRFVVTNGGCGSWRKCLEH